MNTFTQKSGHQQAAPKRTVNDKMNYTMLALMSPKITLTANEQINTVS